MQIAPQWMKLDTNIFAHKKIKKIRRMPEGDSIFTLWIYLICEGMKNIVNPGVIEFSAGIPTDMNDISEDTSIKLPTVQMAIDIFIRLGMIVPNETGCITVKNLTKHQSLERLQYQRELTRQRQIKYRTKNKELEMANNEDEGVTRDGRVCSETDKIRVDKSREDKIRVDKKLYLSCWNNLATNEEYINKIRCITNKRSNKLITRIKEDPKFIDSFNSCINIIKVTPFLRGENNRKWTPDFDWLIENDTNYNKVLEGKYGKANILTDDQIKDKLWDCGIKDDKTLIAGLKHIREKYKTMDEIRDNMSRIKEAIGWK